MSNSTQITILGAGVSGITTGVVLQLLGFDTKIFAKDRADQPQNPDDPAFASLYPSASVIPHSVFGDQILILFDNSQRIFELLLKEQMKGLSMNQHFEVFEYDTEMPAYAPAMKNFRQLAAPWQSVGNVPHHPGTKELNGWSFDCFFADWPVYLPQLYKWYQQLGGIITIEEIHPEDIRQCSSPIVNCTGLAGRQLFADTGSANIVWKGHLVHIKDAPDICNKLGQSISYNYNPTPGTYSDAKGNTQDIYCYPRNDGWIIGGSRLEGTVDDQGRWTGTQAARQSIEINGVAVPAPIIELNSQILEHSYNVELNSYTEREALIGYRYIRGTEAGLRLEKAVDGDTLIIHNYGHGGAGVTLSWGCALRVAELLSGDIPATKLRNNLSSSLLKSLQAELAATLQEKHSRTA